MNSLLNIVLATLGLYQNIEMADVFRTEGKIFVVVGVIGIVFLGLVIYLFSLDRKISKIEKELNSK